MPDLHQQRVVELARRNAQRYTFRYRSLLLHWMGRAFRRAAPVDLAPLPPVETGQVAVTWGGHATALVRYHRLSVLFDPVMARSVNGVRRELASGLALESLTDVDLVLVSHAAADHLDVGTLARLSRSATVVVPPRAGARVSPLGFARLVELSVGSRLEHRGIEVTAEDVRHGERASPAQSYVVRGDGPTVFFCGASGYFPGFADIGRRHLPDVALLPIGGYWPRSFRARHMSPLDALYAFEDLRARVMVPIRYGTFALSYERVNDPERWLAELVTERHLERFVVRLAAGESRVFVPPGAPGYDTSRFEVGVDAGGASAAAMMARARPSRPPVTLRRGTMSGSTPAPAPLPLPLPPAEPEALTVVGGPSVVSPVVPAPGPIAPAPGPIAPAPGPVASMPGPPRRPPALIIEHDLDPFDNLDGQDGATAVFDRPMGLLREGESRAAKDADDDDDDASTRASI